MKMTQAIVVALALIVGAAAGYMVNPANGESSPKPSVKTPKAKAIADDGGKATVKALRARIAELESELAAKAEKAAEPPAQKIGEEGRPEPGRFNMQEMRDRMAKEHPEQFAQFTNHVARMRQDRLNRAQSKLDFLSSVDTSRMSPAARKTHERLMDLIAKREELEQKMHAAHSAAEMPSAEESGAMFQEMHGVNQEIRELNRQERDNLLTETAKNLGFSSDDAGEITGTIKEIYEATDNGWGGRGGRGGRGGFGGPGFGGRPAGGAR